MEFNERDALIREIRSWDGNYNSDLRLYRFPFNSPGYHTSIKQADYVHSLHPNTMGALALLDSGLPEYRQRAYDMLEHIVSLQDQDPASATFGIWPWYYEEPLQQMAAPDLNYADFIGKQLLLTVIRHKNRLSEPLYGRIRQAVCNAADAIIKRDVGPEYTNIAIMGAFVTLISGESFDRGDYVSYGLNRLERFLDFTRQLNTFQEYNSPTYGVITILELSKLFTETKQDRAKQICSELLQIAWEIAARHFHVPTGEWSGPHSRCYSTKLSNWHRSFLQYATKGSYMRFSWDSLNYSTEWYGSGLECPNELVHFFIEAGTRTIRDICYVDTDANFMKQATTYISPTFSLGSFNKEHLWNQCRSLVGYFGNQDNASYLHVRFLNDGYDFSSALLTCDQQEGDALFGINFFKNGGNTHPSLDRTEGLIHTGDLRIRFEFGGAAERLGVVVSDPEKVEVRLSSLWAAIRSVYSAFEEQGQETVVHRLKREIRIEDGKLCVDFILYSGPHRSFDMSRWNHAVFLFTLSIGEKPAQINTTITRQYGRIHATGRTDKGKPMSVVLEEKPFLL
jgi:hypothetical protein